MLSPSLPNWAWRRAWEEVGAAAMGLAGRVMESMCWKQQSLRAGCCYRVQSICSSLRKSTAKIIFTTKHPHIYEICQSVSLSRTLTVASVWWSYEQFIKPNAFRLLMEWLKLRNRWWNVFLFNLPGLGMFHCSLGRNFNRISDVNSS